MFLLKIIQSRTLLPLAVMIMAAPVFATDASSAIDSVKLYQNQALVTREAKLHLNKGLNRIIIKNLPQNLHDWSIRGGFGADFGGTINSMEVIKTPLTQQRREKLMKIEEKLTSLQDQDLILVDDLKTVAGQVSFLESILDFTKTVSAKELTTQTPHVATWDGTLTYVRNRLKELFRERRKIEKDRENVGKDIQKWEFELYQAGGSNYYKNYLSLKNTMSINRTMLTAQQFDKGINDIMELNKELHKSGGPMDFEKQVEVEVYSPSAAQTTLTLNYLIPGTQWNMKYDIRADDKKNRLSMTIYGDIRQTTGEDWNDITLSLSTGQPAQSIAYPAPDKWLIDIVKTYPGSYASKSKYYEGAAGMQNYEMSGMAAAAEDKMLRQDEVIAHTTVEKKGINVEMILPQKQTVPSEPRSHKKTIRDFTLTAGETPGQGGVRFFYELVPSKQADSIIKISVTNSSALPWLQGDAQIFLDGEFMGKSVIPYTPQGMEREIVLGTENRITGKKELIKKYEDNTGLFSGSRRILYSYKITAQNDCPEEKDVLIHDMIPISGNEKIDIAVEKLSHPFVKDPETEKNADFAQGKRTWKFTIPSHKKVEISFDLIVSFDKDLNVKGLR